MTTTQQNKLTVLVKRFLGFFRILFVAVAVVWPITVMVVGLNIPTDPELRHTDINAYISFHINSDVATKQLATTADGGVLLMKGQGEVLLNNTLGSMSWYLAGAISEILLLIFLYGLFTMRELFVSLAEGNTFTQVNVDRVKKIGLVMLGWHIIAPAFQYFGGRIMLEDIAFNVPGIHLFPSFELNIGGIFTGLAIIVLSGVLKEATGIHHDQTLTI